MNFYLKKTPEGRAYISQIAPKESEEVLQTIDAETWIKAREEVCAEYFKHKPGYGYFTE